MRMFITHLNDFNQPTPMTVNISRDRIFSVLLLINTCKQKKKLWKIHQKYETRKSSLCSKKRSSCQGDFFHSNEEAWRERKCVWMNTTKKSIYSLLDKLYVTAWKKTNLCSPLCLSAGVCARENFDRLALWMLALE